MDITDHALVAIGCVVAILTLVVGVAPAIESLKNLFSGNAMLRDRILNDLPTVQELDLNKHRERPDDKEKEVERLRFFMENSSSIKGIFGQYAESDSAILRTLKKLITLKRVSLWTPKKEGLPEDEAIYRIRTDHKIIVRPRVFKGTMATDLAINDGIEDIAFQYGKPKNFRFRFAVGLSVGLFVALISVFITYPNTNVTPPPPAELPKFAWATGQNPGNWVGNDLAWTEGAEPLYQIPGKSLCSANQIGNVAVCWSGTNPGGKPANVPSNSQGNPQNWCTYKDNTKINIYSVPQSDPKGVVYECSRLVYPTADKPAGH